MPKYEAFDSEGYPLHALAEAADLVDLFQSRFDHQEYTWFAPGRAAGQLLDNCFVSRPLEGQVARCEVLHEFRTSGLTDHSSILIEAFG